MTERETSLHPEYEERPEAMQSLTALEHIIIGSSEQGVSGDFIDVHGHMANYNSDTGEIRDDSLAVLLTPLKILRQSVPDTIDGITEVEEDRKQLANGTRLIGMVSFLDEPSIFFALDEAIVFKLTPSLVDRTTKRVIPQWEIVALSDETDERIDDPQVLNQISLNEKWSRVASIQPDTSGNLILRLNGSQNQQDAS